MKVNLALKGLPRFTCLPEPVGQHRTTAHLLPDEADAVRVITEGFADVQAGRLPEFPTIEWYVCVFCCVVLCAVMCAAYALSLLLSQKKQATQTKNQSKQTKQQVLPDDRRPLAAGRRRPPQQRALRAVGAVRAERRAVVVAF